MWQREGPQKILANRKEIKENWTDYKLYPTQLSGFSSISKFPKNLSPKNLLHSSWDN